MHFIPTSYTSTINVDLVWEDFQRFYELISSTPISQSHAIQKYPNLTRCVTHNDHVINLILTIDIYDKLVIAREKIKNKYVVMCIMLL
jgi:hypothetical protein